MASDFVAPTRDLDGFHCPHCGTYSHQEWVQAVTVDAGVRVLTPDIHAARCSRCNRMSLWVEKRMIFPPVLTAPEPHFDFPESAIEAYREAREVASASPRAAAALLRLCFQQLVGTLGVSSGDLNAAVKKLVAMGLPPLMQQSMDAVRLIGNEAVHPGSLDLKDDPRMVLALFDLVNLIVETMVTQPRMVKELYDRLPASKKNAVEARDNP